VSRAPGELCGIPSKDAWGDDEFATVASCPQRRWRAGVVGMRFFHPVHRSTGAARRSTRVTDFVEAVKLDHLRVRSRWARSRWLSPVGRAWTDRRSRPLRAGLPVAPCAGATWWRCTVPSSVVDCQVGGEPFGAVGAVRRRRVQVDSCCRLDARCLPLEALSGVECSGPTLPANSASASCTRVPLLARSL